MFLSHPDGVFLYVTIPGLVAATFFCVTNWDISASMK